MKLNLDCVRSIMLAVESKPLDSTYNISDLTALIKFSSEDVIYCCLKLYEAGFLDITTVPIMRSNLPGIKSIGELTYSGHNFLETIRADDIWSNTKKRAKSIGSFSLPIIQSIASGLINAKIKELF